MKKKIIRLKEKVQNEFKRIKTEHLVRNYMENNVLFLAFLLTCLFNSTILRFFTMHTLENYLALKPILADATILIIIGSFGYLLKPKNRFTYYFIFYINNFFRIRSFIFPEGVICHLCQHTGSIVSHHDIPNCPDVFFHICNLSMAHFGNGNIYFFSDIL